MDSKSIEKLKKFTPMQLVSLVRACNDIEQVERIFKEAIGYAPSSYSCWCLQRDAKELILRDYIKMHEGKDSTWKSDFSKISFHKPYYVKLKDGYECFGLWPCKDYLSCCEMCTITGNILHEIDGWGHEKAVSIDVVAFKEIDGVDYD